MIVVKIFFPHFEHQNVLQWDTYLHMFIVRPKLVGQLPDKVLYRTYVYGYVDTNKTWVV